MKNTLYWWLLLLSMTFVAACSDGGEDVVEPDPKPTPSKPAITLDVSSSDFTTDGGSNTISFTTAAPWTAEVLNSRADAWCSVSPTDGPAGDAEITVTTTANDTPDNRSASIVIKAGTTEKTITVSQKQKDALTVTSDKFEVSAEGGEVTIEVKANIDFEYTISEKAKAWIASADSRALKTTTLVFDVSANEDTEKREGSITITSGSFKETVTVYQEGTVPVITLTQNEFVVPSAGDVIAVEVKSNVDVEVELPAETDWLSEDKSRAMSTNTYYFTIAESQEYDQRTAEIKFTNKANNLSETVKVVQVQKDAIVVAKDSYTVDNNGGEIIIEVGHNIDFEIEIADEWIVQKKENSRAFVTDKLIFNISPNEGYDNRESSIRFVSKDKGIVQTVKIYQAQKNAIIISQKNIIVDENGGDVEFEVKSNIDYTISEPNVDWLHILKSRALTSQTLRYTVDANTTYDSRETSIIITSDNLADTINIAQTQKDAIVLAKNEYGFTAEGGELDFEILTNVDVTVSIPDSVADWISHVESRALESQTLHFDIAPCDLSENRSGIITLSGGDAVQTILIKQDGLNAILEAERNALIAFYKATGGDNWHSIWGHTDVKNENWCSDLPVSHWAGVRTNEQGFVTELRLPGCYLTGTIPSEIGNLTELEALQLNNNNLGGELPKELFKLNKLKVLDLMTNWLSGEIPEEIGNLTNLTELWLHHNRFTGPIPESLIKLTKLIDLRLCDNPLSGLLPESFYEWDFWKNLWGMSLKDKKYEFEEISLPGPEATITCFDGKIIDLKEEYKQNKFTILFQWSKVGWETAEILPQMKSIHDLYADKGIKIIGWANSNSDTKESAMAYMQESEMLWDNFYYNSSDFNFTYDYTHLENTFGTLPWYPSNYVTSITVVDSNGKIVFSDLFGDRNRVYNKDGYLISLVENDFKLIKDDLYESTDYSQDGVIVTLQTATKGNGIDVVLMGDGYSDRKIADGTYKADMEYIYNNLFTEEPYKSFKDHFNVYYVNVVSENEVFLDYSNTALGGFFGEGTLVGGNDNTVFVYALNAISGIQMNEALIIVAMNSDNYAGTCYMYQPELGGDYSSGPSVSYFPKGGDATTFAQLLHHEACGHGFAKLADEYAYEEYGAISADEINAIKEQQSSWGWWKNVDFTNDLSQIRWSKFINDSRYANEGLGAYEGGLTYWTGVWRPTENSIMLANTGGFNAPSREAIYYRIHKLAYGDSWVYDYEDFVEYDAINRNSTTARSLNHVEVPKKFKPLHAPVVKRQTWKDAK